MPIFSFSSSLHRPYISQITQSSISPSPLPEPSDVAPTTLTRARPVFHMHLRLHRPTDPHVHAQPKLLT